MKVPVMKPNGSIVMVREKLAGVLVKRGRFSFPESSELETPKKASQENQKGGAKATSRAMNTKKGS
ncbi:hypothetical protein [Pandoraea sp. CB10b_02]|uniref:hypothetical protein n=1 Tax=Pandoraea sp. CB10b_02 TaxID=2014535 RepID=UPI00257DDF29|nr:hypothetical protein [Pandoraea sp. CB10b_02]